MNIYNKFFHHMSIYDKIENDGLLGKESQQILTTNYMASTVHYKGTVKNVNELLNIKGKNGDVMVETSTQNAYIYCNNTWMLLSKGKLIHYENERDNDDIPIEPRKVRSICSHCGGVLTPNLYNEITICDYCDCANSTFIYESDPEFNKI